MPTFSTIPLAPGLRQRLAGNGGDSSAAPVETPLAFLGRDPHQLCKQLFGSNHNNANHTNHDNDTSRDEQIQMVQDLRLQVAHALIQQNPQHSQRLQKNKRQRQQQTETNPFPGHDLLSTISTPLSSLSPSSIFFGEDSTSPQPPSHSVTGIPGLDLCMVVADGVGISIGPVGSGAASNHSPSSATFGQVWELQGPPASGKTKWALQLAAQHQQNNNDICSIDYWSPSSSSEWTNLAKTYHHSILRVNNNSNHRTHQDLQETANNKRQKRSGRNTTTKQQQQQFLEALRFRSLSSEQAATSTSSSSSIVWKALCELEQSLHQQQAEAADTDSSNDLDDHVPQQQNHRMLIIDGLDQLLPTMEKDDDGDDNDADEQSNRRPNNQVSSDHNNQEEGRHNRPSSATTSLSAIESKLRYWVKRLARTYGLWVVLIAGEQPSSNSPTAHRSDLIWKHSLESWSTPSSSSPSSGNVIEAETETEVASVVNGVRISLVHHAGRRLTDASLLKQQQSTSSCRLTFAPDGAGLVEPPLSSVSTRAADHS